MKPDYRTNDGKVTIYFCDDCGSPNVQMSAWVEVNSGAVVDGEGPCSDAFCPACDEIASLGEVSVDPWNHGAALRRCERWSEAAQARYSALQSEACLLNEAGRLARAQLFGR